MLRALVTYAVVVLAGVAVFVTKSDGPLTLLLCGGWAVLLAVPLAVVAFEPAPQQPRPDAPPADPRPVLQRNREPRPRR